MERQLIAKSGTLETKTKDKLFSSFSQKPHFSIQSILHPEKFHSNRSKLFQEMLQAKLEVNQPGDEYEQEADKVADMVMRMPEPKVQRQKEGDEEEEGQTLQAKELPGQVPVTHGQYVPPIVHEVLRSPGQPLDKQTRAFMEPRFGHDFSKVRVHADERAAESARAVNARAFTVGRNVVFGSGEYSPMQESGRRLLAHELVHVVQQGSIFCQKPVLQGWFIESHLQYDNAKNEGIKKDQTHEFLTKTALEDSTRINRHISLSIKDAFSSEAKQHLIKGCAQPDVEKKYLEDASKGDSPLQQEQDRKAYSGLFHAHSTKESQIDSNIDSFTVFAAAALNHGKTLYNSIELFLGKALHAAQDRGAHQTPCSTERGEKCKFPTDDNPTKNENGWLMAQLYTRAVLESYFSMLESSARERLQGKAI